MSERRKRPEEWKPIDGYAEYYEISSYGRVRRIPHVREDKKKYGFKILRPALGNHGYFEVALWKEKKQKTHRIHRLVALNFIKRKKISLVVNHIDKNRQNNFVDNLEWVTFQRNVEHGIGKPIIQLTLSNEFIKKWNSAASVKLNLKIDDSCIIKVAKGFRNKAGGFKWKYA